MSRLNKVIIYILILLSIYNFYFITEMYNGHLEEYDKLLYPRYILNLPINCIYKNEKLYENFAYRLPDVNAKLIVNPFKLNPYDKFFTYIENIIVWATCLFGITYFFLLPKKAIMTKCHFDTKPLNRKSFLYFIVKKFDAFKKLVKNEKTK